MAASCLTKSLIGGLSLTGILAIVFLVLYVTKSPQDDTPAPEWAPEQIAASARILTTMDQTADPCNDFWQYSCGGWLQNNVIPSSKGRLASFDECDDYVSMVLKQELENTESSESSSINSAKYFYQSCMNSEARNGDDAQSIKSMTDFTAKLGGWPIGGDSIASDDESFTDLVANYAKQASTMAIFMVYTGVDKQATENHLVQIDQPALMLGSVFNYESMLTDDSTQAKRDSVAKLKNAYVQYMSDFAHHYCVDSGYQTCELDAIKAAAEAAYQLENELANIKIPAVIRSADADLTWNKKTFNQFEKNHTDFKYGLDVAQKLYGQKDGQEIITGETFVNDMSEKFFDQLGGWLNTKMADNEAQFMTDLRNLFGFRALSGLVQALPDKYLTAEEILLEARMGTTSRPDRFQTCVELTNDAMTFPVGSLYVQRAFAEESKEKIQAMIQLVEKVFKGPILDDADWMDAATKDTASFKADQVLDFIGYPSYIINDIPAMDADYDDYQPQVNDFFNNLVGATSRKLREDWDSLDQPTTRDRWSTGPAIVNAWYSPTRNTITFPAGILQPPFYDAGASSASNYGAIGTVIGHELTHGFDDTGSQYDPYGNKEDWWSADSKAAFNQNTQCMADQYSSYYWDLAGAYVNGKSTLGENIADNGGIRESFYAYQDWAASNDDVYLPGLEHLSFEQQFFLGFSQVWCALYTPEEALRRIEEDVHSPNPYRVQGPLSNFEEFAKAFNCKKGDVYYPPKEDTCQVW